MPSRLYLPLRGNAHSLVAGAPAAAVRRRLILGALMHDHVIVDDGMWEGHAGPTGSWQIRVPPNQPLPEAYQTARQRSRSRAGRFHAAMRSSDSTGPMRTMMSSDTSVSWRATFAPIKHEFQKAYPWLDFVSADLTSDDKRIVSKMVDEDTRDGILTGLIPDQFSRRLVIGSADYGLVFGSRMQAAVSMDSMHQRVLVARAGRGQATPVFGTHALTIMFPSVDGMTWDDVDEARRIKGLPELRAILAEIEEVAWSEAENGRQLDERIVQSFIARVDTAVAAMQPSFRGTVASVGVGLALGLITGPLPVVVGLAAGAAQAVASAASARLRYESSWIAAADRLRRRSGVKRAPR